ncbi:hypothetical protein NW754_014622 [Fusarium falciforme]|uniref:Uncharacterized protein n=1 Tax=Fusarium falciforme TaxID=195108 RepID=A0A9W8QUR4_9HYPO|nr:hypothetical protein NW754_014622 [Fusarium falciforme]KAJ4179203.1 hypothetical protein NW755_012672 [Fusarium falciforme]KAJ4247056.1 hypothetical protein NW757_009207 [Fusarium falciforme]
MANAEFINASDELPAVPNDEASSLTNQRNSQLQGPQQADVPSLMASYDTSTDDEIRDKARGAIRALEDLLCRAKILALGSLPRLGTFIDDERLDIVICHMLDNGGSLALLRGYVDKLVHTKAAVTSFMASKFDRATSRLASCIKARISTLEKFAAPGDACPSSVGEEQSWDLAGTIKQCRENANTVGPLFWKVQDRLHAFEVPANPEAGKIPNDINFIEILSRLAS